MQMSYLVCDTHAAVTVQVRRVTVEQQQQQQQNNMQERRQSLQSTPRLSSHPSSSPFASFLSLALLLLLALLTPHPTFASSGPMLVSTEYEIRTLRVGTIQHASPQQQQVSSDEYELAWRQYEILAVDLIFDQPLYISSARSIQSQNHAAMPSLSSSSSSNNNAAAEADKPISPHHGTNHTLLPSLEGSLRLECSGSVEDALFTLGNSWEGVDVTTGQTVAGKDFWTTPSDALLPIFSPHNTLKDDIIRLFDREIDAPTNRATSLFGGSSATAGAAAINGGVSTSAFSNAVGKPNVLSLMAVLAFQEGEHTKRYLHYIPNVNSPLSHCSVRYTDVFTRQAQIRSEAEHARIIMEEMRLELIRQIATGGMENITVPAEPIPHSEEELELKLAAVAGLTNFKGHEVDATEVGRLSLRSNMPHPFIAPRSVLKVAPGIAQEIDLSDGTGAAGEEDREEQLYAHSPLEQEQAKKEEKPVVSAKPVYDEEDPFNNILLDMGSATQFVSMILRPVCHGVMRPATRGTTDLLLDDIMTELGTNLFDSVTDEVGPDLSIMLGVTAGRNVSNILQDSLTYAVTKTMTQAVTANVSPYLIDRLIKNLPGPLHTVIQAILEKKIPDRLERTMPVILSRVLSVTLTHSLTRSIPHVVVPSVALSLGLGHAGSLSRPKAYYEVCMRCYMQSVGLMPPVRMSPPDLNPDGYDSGVGSGGQKAGSECGACPTSTYSMYHTIYTAATYTDYYSEYYADYYSQAMQQVDEAVYADDGEANGIGGEEDEAAAGGDGGDGGGGGDGGDGGDE